jgi:hypothetical protein
LIEPFAVAVAVGHGHHHHHHHRHRHCHRHHRSRNPSSCRHKKGVQKKKPCPGANARAGLVERAGTRSSGEQVQSGHPTLRNSTITIIDASYCTVQYSTVRGNLLATPLDGTSWFSSRYRFCWSKRSYPSG